MTIRRRRTDVVVVGLGGAGGVAVEPLTAAGLKVVALEAGTWLGPRDFAPDELRNNYRGWPQAAQKANREIPVHRANSAAPDSPRGGFLTQAAILKITANGTTTSPVPRGAFVMIEAEHLCMSMRGVRKPGSLTVTSAVRGLFKDSAATRSEVMALLGLGERRL